MATLDEQQNTVTLRIVYSGAPMSGKTESIRSLSELLFGSARSQNEFYTPDDTSGRTLYFDWLNYVGGYFKGYKLNCQLISVPGQKTLQSRRQFLLEMADVVVFVVDSEIEKLDVGMGYYREMQPWLQRSDEPPVGVIVQANKRDLTNAAPMQLIREKFGDDPNLLMLESIATQSSGTRETFVSAVRIGVERATWLIDNNKMLHGSTDLDSGSALLQLIKTKEVADRTELERAHADLGLESTPVIPEPKSENLDLSRSQLHQIIIGTPLQAPENQQQPDTFASIDIEQHENEQLLENASNDADSTYQPKLPNKDVGAGSVFPPVSGRIILHQLKNDSDVIMNQNDAGDWEVTIDDQWKLINRKQDCYETVNDARKDFVSNAQSHQKLKNILSEHRCLVITEELGQNYPWRIWHVVRVETCLEELLSNALTHSSPRHIAERVYIIAEKFMEAHQLIASNTPQIPYTLDNIGLNKSIMGLDKSYLTFIGFVPDINESVELPSALDALMQHFKQPIHDTLVNTPNLSIPFILYLLGIYAKGNDEKTPMVDVLRTLFIGEH